MSGYLITGEDVTERERARAALLLALDDREAAVQHLRALDRTRKNLLSTVSHELRTPITSILGYTEMLEDGIAGELAPRQSVMLGRVTRNSHRLLELVENLITLSKAEAHNLRSVPARCDLVAVARAAYAVAEPAARASGVDLAFRTDDVAVELWGQADQLERMLANLVGNAVKFTEAGGRVDLELRSTGRQAVLVVADTGIGIPPDERDQVFDQFFRSSLARDREIQGTGLGLSIVKAIVDQHRGTVTVESTPGVGSRFVVTLPLAGPDEDQGVVDDRELVDEAEDRATVVGTRAPDARIVGA
jgi:signal transduction histidine kinase